MKALQWTLWIVGLGLQSLLLAALSQGVGRKFPALLAYVICLVGTTTGDILASVMLGESTNRFVTYYWSAELVRQSALFGLVVSLASHVMPEDRKGQAYHRLFTVAAIAVWAGSIMWNYDPRINRWMTVVVRNLSFFTGMLNLFAWFAYARARERDMIRLMVVAGLGLQMTGEAIGQAIRQMRAWDNSNLIGGLIVVLSHLLCLFIWWRALRAGESSPSEDERELGLGDLESRHSPSG